MRLLFFLQPRFSSSYIRAQWNNYKLVGCDRPACGRQAITPCNGALACLPVGRGNAPYNEIYNIIHNIKRFKGIVKGDLTIHLTYVIKILFVVAGFSLRIECDIYINAT